MTIYAGIDEAGLAPILGPFTLGLVKFKLPEDCDIFSNPDGHLLGALAPVADFNPTRGGPKLLIRDSKKLFSQSGSIRRLEEAALAFGLASRAGFALPSKALTFLDQFALFTEGLSDYPWHSDEALPIPIAASAHRVAGLAQEIVRCLGEKGITVESARVTVVPVRSFNGLLSASTNKATATFSLIRTLLEDLWSSSAPDENLLVRVDKQGGRDNYLPVLEGCIQGADFQPVVEGGEESRYIVEKDGRRMVVHFALRSDAAYLPVTLAGILAKYSRELLMNRQNAWFAAHEPSLSRTAGYIPDALRWLQDALPVRQRLKIDDALLIRNR